MNKKILYNFASRSRPDKFFEVLDSVIENSSNDNFQIICTSDVDDSSMLNDNVRDRIKFYHSTKIFYGVSKSKVDAINRNVGLADNDWGILINLSDDMPVVKKGFDEIIRKEYDNGFTGLLHTPDGLQNERLCTFAIMDRGYYEIDRWIYHPNFLSVFADNFQHQLAVKRGKYKFLNNQLVVHKHYRAGFGEADELMKKNDSNFMYATDRATYEELIKEYELA